VPPAAEAAPPATEGAPPATEAVPPATIDAWTSPIPIFEQERQQRKRMIILGAVIAGLLVVSLMISSGKQADEVAPEEPRSEVEPIYAFSCPKGAISVRAKGGGDGEIDAFLVELGAGCEDVKGLELALTPVPITPIHATESTGSDEPAKGVSEGGPRSQGRGPRPLEGALTKAKPHVHFKRPKPERADRAAVASAKPQRADRAAAASANPSNPQKSKRPRVPLHAE
jgi:hypothetical protein